MEELSGINRELINDSIENMVFEEYIEASKKDYKRLIIKDYMQTQPKDYRRWKRFKLNFARFISGVVGYSLSFAIIMFTCFLWTELLDAIENDKRAVSRIWKISCIIPAALPVAMPTVIFLLINKYIVRNYLSGMKYYKLRHICVAEFCFNYFRVLYEFGVILAIALIGLSISLIIKKKQ